MKVVINTCYGGFGLSGPAQHAYLDRKNLKYTVKPSEYPSLVPEGIFYVNGKYFSDSQIERNDPVLVQLVEEMGDTAWGNYSQLAIIDIPDDVDFIIEEYDGYEHVAHRTWGQ